MRPHRHRFPESPCLFRGPYPACVPHTRSTHPLVLALETSNPTADPGRSASVALVRLPPPGESDAGLTPLAIVRLGDTEANGLLPSIDRCFQEAGLAPDALRVPGSRIAVSIGPGGYTSVRIAVTAAKVLCDATGAACVAVPTAHVVAARVSNARPFAVALASKRETAWLTLFNADGAVRRLLGLVDDAAIDTLGSEGVDLLVIDRFAPARMVERAQAAGIRIEPPTFDAMACAELGATIEPIDPLALEPMYPREPEAVTKWRALRSAQG